MRDDRALQRWMALEMGKLAQGLVTAPRPLSELLAEPAPTAPTRGGQPHVFDRAALADLTGRLGALTRATLRLPITVFLDHETLGDGYVADAAAVQALVELGVGRTPREGRLWMGVPLWRDLAQRFPTLVQFVHI